MLVLCVTQSTQAKHCENGIGGMNFFSRTLKKLRAHSVKDRIVTIHLKPDEVTSLVMGAPKSVVEQHIQLTKAYTTRSMHLPSKMLIKRTAAELRVLEESLPNSSKDSWTDYGDRIIRNDHDDAYSVLRIVDTKVYDHKHRCETGDWYFRREYWLSQPMFDAIWKALVSEFPTSGERLGEAIIRFEDVYANDIICDPKYSGSVTRAKFPIKSVLLKTMDEVNGGSYAVRLCER